MILNGKSLLQAAPIKDMFDTKQVSGLVSFGMSEAGYDIRIKQNVSFSSKNLVWAGDHLVNDPNGNIDGAKFKGHFTIASAIEEFQMPNDLVGIVHDKSTWARHGLSVFNTVIEPGWKGFLTLELVYHGQGELFIPAGSGIAQVVFHCTTDETCYTGKYQDQPDMPVAPIRSDK